MTQNYPLEASPTVSKKLGAREKSKLDKLRRIQAAATHEFIKKGYEAATTRDIARHAKVSVGTLFVYAKDKRELLMMVLNDGLEQVGKEAVKNINYQLSLLEQILCFFKPRYVFWAAQPRLGRPVVTEIFDVANSGRAPGPQIARFYKRRDKTIKSLETIVAKAQACGKAAPDIEPAYAAFFIMTLYISAVRRWLDQEAPDANEGISELRRLMQLAIQGIGAK